MSTKQITIIVGARPNFVKAAPLLDQMAADREFNLRLVHTGQHFDAGMSDVFFEQLSMPKPDVYLNINRKSVPSQVADVMLALENEFLATPPDLVVVFGDVNSTLAAALVANKMSLPLAHVEAGLRSFDRAMPEEHNRMVTDILSDYLFTPSADADENLRAEGIADARIFRVGNIMVDSLLRFQSKAKGLDAWNAFGLKPKQYALVTLHRPANVDDSGSLEEILGALVEIASRTPVLLPAHPRTAAHLKDSGWNEKLRDSGVQVVAPQSYLEFLNLMMNARVILTDSGGIQEESTVLGVPCLTMRENTERPITIKEGSNRLVGTKKDGILQGFELVMKEGDGKAKSPDLWDGKTASRIHQVLKSL